GIFSALENFWPRKDPMPVSPQRKFELQDSAVGDALNAARRKAQLELQDAGPLAGLDWRVLSRIERGERPCRVTELVALAAAYSRPPETILLAATGDPEAWKELLNP
ncbi:helix-turn-helix domain-containing protein, partial [Mycobacteroides abscessus]